MKRSFKGTKTACYVGYFIQAIVNNLAPILFVIFRKEFGLSIEQIGTLVLVNFLSQAITDVISVKVVDKVGYKKIVLVSHLLAGIGLVLMGILPKIMTHSFVALLISTVICALGSGMIEVTISPIIESIPSDHKASEMSFLHSFYCWGQMITVIFSTIFIKVFGIEFWFILPILWSLVSFVNFFNFMSVPFMETLSDDERIPIKHLLKSKYFIIAMVLMLCAGASELAMSQWSSYFAEMGLGVTKIMGDLFGPCLFAFFMGLGRLVFGFLGSKINLPKAMIALSVLCIICYGTTAFVNLPLLSLFTCALTGFSISLFWPGTFSISAKYFPNGGGAMFGILAIMGDLGCSLGPWLVGFISSAAQSADSALSDGNAVKFGLGFGMIFPVIMIIGLIYLIKSQKSEVDN
ncbi:MAG: MFS transporter [Oscillospiraceae bacterium]